MSLTSRRKAPLPRQRRLSFAPDLSDSVSVGETGSRNGVSPETLPASVRPILARRVLPGTLQVNKTNPYDSS